MKLKLTLTLLILCFLSFNLKAGVNLKNGNYYVSYTDLLLQKYNSAFKNITRTKALNIITQKFYL